VHPRVAEEWPDILSVYPDAVHAAAPERIELSLDLEPDRYALRRTTIAILIPPGYRATSPDGFLIRPELRLRSGEALPVSDAAGVGMAGWLLVSFHMIDSAGQSTWHPTADPSRGDNFISYIASIEAFLARGCN
jgi:hypothetical protein